VVGVSAGSSRTGVGDATVYRTSELFSKELHDAPVGRGHMVKMSRLDVQT
jgi:hypothetical protein